jgi:hypothetical protein
LYGLEIELWGDVAQLLSPAPRHPHRQIRTLWASTTLSKMHATRLEVLLLRWHKANRFARASDLMAAAHSVYSTKSQATGIYGSIRFQPSKRLSAKGIYGSIRFQPSSKPRDIRGLAPQSSHLLVPSLVRSGTTSHRTCDNYPTQGRHRPSTLIPQPMRMPPYHERQDSPRPEGPNNPSSALGRCRATKAKPIAWL